MFFREQEEERRFRQASPFGSLVVCDCGHGIGVHDDTGCAYRRRCKCLRDSAVVLDEVITQTKTAF
jgi:hypothetical protein